MCGIKFYPPLVAGGLCLGTTQETNEFVPPSAVLADGNAVDEQADQLKHHVRVHGRT